MSAAEMPPEPTKLEIFLQGMEETSGTQTAVEVFLDPRLPEVVLPAKLLGEPHTVLQYSYDFANAIVFRRVDEDGIASMMSFSGVNQDTFVPWGSVFRIRWSPGNDYWWLQDSPPEAGLRGSKTTGMLRGRPRVPQPRLALVPLPPGEELCALPTPPRGHPVLVCVDGELTVRGRYLMERGALQ